MDKYIDNAYRIGREIGYYQAVTDYFEDKWDFKSPAEIIKMGKQFSEQHKGAEKSAPATNRIKLENQS